MNRLWAMLWVLVLPNVAFSVLLGGMALTGDGHPIVVPLLTLMFAGNAIACIRGGWA